MSIIEEIDIIQLSNLIDIAYTNIPLNNKFNCPNCNSSNIVNCICSDCFVNLSYTIDYENHGMMDINSSTNTYGCTFLNLDLPDTSSYLSFKNLAINSKIKMAHKWITNNNKEKNLIKIYNLIYKMCYKCNLSKNIEDSAKIMYTQIYYNKENDKKNLIKRGINYKSFILSCISHACKINNEYLSKNELSDMFDINKNEVKKGEKIFNNLIKIKNFNVKYIVMTPDIYIIRFCNKLNFTKLLTNTVIKITANLQKLHIINDHKPNSVATCAVYIMIILNNLNINKSYISKILEISQATITKTFKKMEPFIDILLNDKLCNLVEIKIKQHQQKIIYNNNFAMNCIKFNVKNTVYNNNLYYKHISENISLNIKIIETDNFLLKSKLNNCFFK